MPSDRVITVLVTHYAEGSNYPGQTAAELPAWCEADPVHGAALYLFGHIDAVTWYRMTATVIDYGYPPVYGDE